MATRIPGLITGDEPLPDDDAMAQMAQVPGLLSTGTPEETPEQAAAAIRKRLEMLDRNRMMAPESGYAMRPEPILGGPAYKGLPAGQILSPAERQYWKDYSEGLQQTELQKTPPEVEDPGMLARIAREAQRVAPMPPATGPGGATYPLYQSPYDLYQSLQMSPRNFDTWATRRAQEAVSR
jgi:hypothetical protein